MQNHSGTRLLVILALFFHGGLVSAEDLFNGAKPTSFTPLQHVARDQTVGGYPIPNLGNDLVVAELKTVRAGGVVNGIAIGLATLIDARDNRLFASIHMQANLEYAGSAIDWTDEPCKKDNFLWKKSTGGNFSNINCVTISHLTNFSPDFPTVVDVRFTRYSGSGRRLSYFVFINPEAFGIDRDAEKTWEANGWHKNLIQNDPKKVEFLSRLTKWTEDVQNRMDAAFDKKQDAFSSLPPLQSYF